MVLYKKKTRPIFRYALATIVLALGLTLTVVDVYGLQLPFGHNSEKSYNNYLNKKIETTDDSAQDIVLQADTYDDQDKQTDNIPTSVPEPTTIILLASGLGLLRMSRKKS